MHNDPILAVATLRPGCEGYRVARTMHVIGGLHCLRGNKRPYFSLTCNIHRKGHPNQCWSGGCNHELILKKFPKFADLAALHLCDITGEPIHAVENGWYKLAGALDGAGERYHAGNSEYNFPVTPPADKPWKNTEHRRPTPDECLQMFADHFRVSLEEATAIKNRVLDAMSGSEANYQRMIGFDRTPRDGALAQLNTEVETLRPRWKAEAAACILHHNLQIYGAPYEPTD